LPFFHKNKEPNSSHSEDDKVEQKVQTTKPIVNVNYHKLNQMQSVNSELTILTRETSEYTTFGSDGGFNEDDEEQSRKGKHDSQTEYYKSN
jgi:hypothetical protein